MATTETCGCPKCECSAEITPGAALCGTCANGMCGW